MTEQELRALVRDVVARRLGQDVVHRSAFAPRATADTPSSIVHGASSSDAGPSHAVYVSLVNVGGECVIEPSVPCNHCNYCKSHGH